MFYLKETVSPSIELKIDLHDDNVFCMCPGCGCDVQVDLADLFKNDHTDLYDTAVFCSICGDHNLKQKANR